MEMGPIRMFQMAFFVLGVELVLALLSPECFVEEVGFFFLVTEVWIVGIILGILGKFIFKFKRIGFAILTGIISAYFWFVLVAVFARWVAKEFGYDHLIPLCF